MTALVGDQMLTVRMTAGWCCCCRQSDRVVSWRMRKHCAEERQGGLETFMTLAIEPGYECHRKYDCSCMRT